MALNINGTTGISGVDGSVSAPAVTGTDSNTGITFPSADTIKFSTGGVERFAITNSGLSGDGSGLTGISGGKVLQVKSVAKVDTFSVPGNANGATDVSGLSVTMDAPASSGSKYLVMASVAAASNFVGASILLNGTTTGQLLQGSSAPSGGTNGMSPDLTRSTNANHAAARQMHQFPLIALDSPGTSAAQTYKVQVYVVYVFQSGYALYVNRPNANVVGSAGSQTGSVTNAVSTITVMEIAA